jgi:hypothetical protein
MTARATVLVLEASPAVQDLVDERPLVASVAG